MRARRPLSPAAGVVLAAIAGNFVGVTPAVHAVFGLFLIPIAHEFGWPRAQVSAVLGILAVVTALCYPILGRLADRYGARPLIVGGNLAFAAAVALLATANGSLLQFYLLFALVGITSALPSSMMYAKVVAGWFDARRGAMLGLVGGVGNGAGATLMPIAAGLLMATFGWRGAYLGIAALIALIGFPLLYGLLRDAPRGVPTDAADGEASAVEGTHLREALRTPVFWMLLIAIAVGAGCLTAVFAHVVPVLAERGVATAAATAVVSVFALVTAAWQIAMGWLLDRSRRAQIAAPVYLVPVAGLLLLAHTTNLPLLLLAGALMGIGLGTQFGTLPYFVSRYFGLKAYGSICGLMYAVVMLAQGLTPPLMDTVFDRHGSYALALQAIEIALVAGAALLALLPAYRQRAVAVSAVALH